MAQSRIRPRSPAAAPRAPRWNANPDDVRRSVLKLVLTLVELIRQLLERQAIRRMEQGTLTDDETEAIGLSLMPLTRPSSISPSSSTSHQTS